MRNFNNVMLYGNLTADPEFKTGKKNGKQFATFFIATNRNWKDKTGQIISETDFHRIVAFGKLGEITGTYLKKGSPVLVSGRLTSRSYIDKEGIKRYITEVVLEDFSFLPSGRKETRAVEQQAELVAASA